VIKKPPSKDQIRNSLERDVEAFLQRGNNIEQVPKGKSSRDEATSPIRSNTWQMDNKKSAERTYVPDVVEALDSRKQKEVKAVSRSRKKPRKRLIYDDFGEPLRWVWVDE
jgi:hypothetical protein